MQHLFWLVACTIPLVNGMPRTTTAHYKAVNFAKQIKGKKLKGNVIKEIEVYTEEFCRLECVEEDRCLSYNYFSLRSNQNKFKCQLSDSDRFAALDDFIEDDEVLYRGVESVCERDARSVCGDKGVCIPSYQENSATCNCSDGYTGKPCKPKSCSQLLQDGFTSSGVYTINPDAGKPMNVMCDMTTDGGGWTVFQRRLDGSVDFYRDWASYKKGFGNLNGEFWLGNDNLHRLTAADDVMLRVDLEDFEGDIRYAEYTTFKVADEGDKYRLLIGGYKGTAGNALRSPSQPINNMQFTTKGNDNDILPEKNCAQMYKGGWWYKDCHDANPNGLYYGGGYHSRSEYVDGVNWQPFRGYWYSLKHTNMKLKPSFFRYIVNNKNNT